MKKWSGLVILFLGICFLTACSGAKERDTESNEGNTLFQNASPSTSVLELFCFDGKEGYSDWFSDVNKEQEILDQLSKVKAVPVDSWNFKVKYPMYGMSIGDESGMGIQMLWTNGYLITREGDVYKFDYNWKQMIKDITWGSSESRKEGIETRKEFEHVSKMPNSCYLACRNDKWDPDMMQEVNTLKQPEGVRLELKNWQRNTVTAALINDSNEVWEYGTYYRLEVNIKNKWYEVPRIADVNWGFESILLGIQPGAATEESFNLRSYGYLPAGTYRIVITDESWEPQEGVWFEYEYTDTAEQVWKGKGLEEAEALTTTEDVYMELVEWNKNAVKVLFVNESDSEWTYGMMFRMDVKIDDTWYTLPDFSATTLQGFIVKPGEDREAAYSIESYGRLPKGTYRIVVEGIAAEYTIS